MAASTTILAIITAVTFITIAALWRRRRAQKLAGHVSELLIYPIKSCRAVKVDNAVCTSLGLKNGFIRDRTFVILTGKNTFLEPINNPKMLCVTPSFHDDEMWVDAPGMETLKISITDLENEKGPLVHTSYKGAPMEGYDCGEDISGWFQRYFNKPDLTLVYFGSELTPTPAQSLKPLGAFMTKDDEFAYAFKTSHMVMTKASMDDLNTRLQEPVPIENFRPNIVVGGTKPYEEDYWSILQIGNDTILKVRLFCTRCLLVNINAETGIKHASEPLKTLRKYRNCWDENLNKISGKKAPVMGLNVGIDQPGQIKIGDPVYVTYK